MFVRFLTKKSPQAAFSRRFIDSMQRGGGQFLSKWSSQAAAYRWYIDSMRRGSVFEKVEYLSTVF